MLERTEGGVDVVRSYTSTRDALHVVRKSGGLDGNGSGLAVAFLGRWRRNARTVALSRRRQREGRAVAVVGVPRSCRGRDVHTVAEQKSGSGYAAAMSGW